MLRRNVPPLARCSMVLLTEIYELTPQPRALMMCPTEATQNSLLGSVFCFSFWSSNGRFKAVLKIGPINATTRICGNAARRTPQSILRLAS